MQWLYLLSGLPGIRVALDVPQVAAGQTGP